MKLISLNTWGGKVYKPLLKFVKEQSLDTDIFCFQEVYRSDSNQRLENTIRTNLLEELAQVLPRFKIFHFPTLIGFNTDTKLEKVDFDLKYGPAIFVKNSISINQQKNYFIFKNNIHDASEDFSNLATPLQYINLSFNGKNLAVFNFHGTCFPFNKLDAPNRLKEARKVREIMSQISGAKIIVGDFNILPQTESLNIIGGDMRNLIKEYNIERTRSKLSPFFGKPNFHKFADYTLVSKEIEVISFEVPDLNISDHLPMILEFE